MITFEKLLKDVKSHLVPFERSKKYDCPCSADCSCTSCRQNAVNKINKGKKATEDNMLTDRKKKKVDPVDLW